VELKKIFVKTYRKKNGTVVNSHVRIVRVKKRSINLTKRGSKRNPNQL